jgi:phage terminase small subunit
MSDQQIPVDEQQAKPLTRKQRAFLEFYLQTWNATRAAEMAGFRCPNQIGPRLIKRDHIQLAIEERLKKESLSADEVLARLSQQARANIGDFVKQAVITLKSKTGQLVEVDGMEMNWDQIRERGYLIKKISVTPSGLSIELYDSQAALVHIGKHQGLFVDKLALTDPTGEKEYGEGIYNRILERVQTRLEKCQSTDADGDPGQPQPE